MIQQITFFVHIKHFFFQTNIIYCVDYFTILKMLNLIA